MLGQTLSHLIKGQTVSELLNNLEEKKLRPRSCQNIKNLQIQFTFVYVNEI